MQEILQRLLLLGSLGFIWALVGVVFSYASRQKLVLTAFMSVSSVINSVIAWIFIFKPASPGGAGGRTTLLVTVMLSAGVLGAVGFQLMGKAMRTGNRGVIWALGQSAMLLPLLSAVAFFGERPSPLNWAGAVMLLAGMALFGISKSERADGGRWLWLAYVVFIITGISLSLTTLPSHWQDFQDTANLRLPVVFSASALYLLSQTLPKGLRSFSRQTILLGCLYSAIVFGGQVLLYKALDVFASFGKVGVVYPIATGVSVVLFALFSLFFLREKLKGALLAGMIAISCGIFMLAAK